LSNFSTFGMLNLKMTMNGRKILIILMSQQSITVYVNVMLLHSKTWTIICCSISLFILFSFSDLESTNFSNSLVIVAAPSELLLFELVTEVCWHIFSADMSDNSLWLDGCQ
jgi:hypothetical protein